MRLSNPSSILLCLLCGLMVTPTLFGQTVVDEDPFGPGPAVEMQSTPPATVEAATPTVPPAAPKQTCYFAVRDPAADQRVREILAQPVSDAGLDFADVPLNEVLENLKDEHGVEVRMDRAALEDLGVSEDEPVTITLRNVRIDTALEAVLSPLELDYLIVDGVVVVTSREGAYEHPVTAVYPVADLQAPAASGNRAEGAGELAGLADLLTTVVEPESWSEKGGMGEIRSSSASVLVVYQTQRVHDQIARLLETLRLVKAENP